MGTMDLENLPESLIDILRGYAVLCSPRNLCFPTALAFSDVHDFLLNRLLLNPHLTKYPPSSEYQKIFWKWAILNLEQLSRTDDDEIDERLYEHISHLQVTHSVPQTLGTRPPVPSFFTYIWPCDTGYETYTLKESRTTIENGTTGMKTWRASLVLAQYLIQYPELVRGKSILELGSGIGLLGLLLSALQVSDAKPGRIILTDVNPQVLSRCEENLALPCNRSSQHKSLMTQELDWNDALQESRRPIINDLLRRISPELVIGADVVFDPSIIPALVAVLQLVLEHSTSQFVLIALTVRNEHTVADFMRQASEHF
ncbi:putative methyltransferase-domain-containing protein [Irpex rosettiformis]|uniref:Methyltransferase-domain-containing protein n=1 Tax=Irpex rosettiformis TaxID=378272 RepID=A0ACB8ULL6_9APHY|nr:putative methyltransferase-domain-containing protein [Irpex rosettiformis]